MNKLLKEVLVITFCLLLGYIFAIYILTNIRGSEYNIVKYDCSLAEISPDFPKEVKQKCRESKHENRSMQ